MNWAKWGILILTATLTSEALANRVTDTDYVYPRQTSVISSLYGACYYAGETKTATLEVPVRNRRLDHYRKYRKLAVTFYPSPYATERLIFIISGMGADEKSCNSRYLAWMAQKAGFAAVILPNTFTASFVVGVSKTGLVGLPARDALDMGEAMTLVRKQLVDAGWVFNSSAVIGYSHGALLTSFLSQTAYASSLNIKSFLLINPPMDLLPNIRTIDSWKKEFDDISLGRLLKIGPKTQKIFKGCGKQISTTESYGDFYAQFNQIGLSESETRGIVGRALGESMKHVILAGQDIDDKEILPAPGADTSPLQQQQQNAREHAAARFTMEKYVRKILMPYGLNGRKLTIDQLNQEASFYSILSKLKADPKIFIMHNEDDFILNDGDAQMLEDSFGENLRLYPAGGHMGNLWHQDNQQAINRWILENRVN